MQDGLCCSYGAAKTKTFGFDCVNVGFFYPTFSSLSLFLIEKNIKCQIPGAVGNAAAGVPVQSNLCGNRLGLPQQVVCSERDNI